MATSMYEKLIEEASRDPGDDQELAQAQAKSSIHAMMALIGECRDFVSILPMLLEDAVTGPLDDLRGKVVHVHSISRQAQKDLFGELTAQDKLRLLLRSLTSMAHFEKEDGRGGSGENRGPSGV